MTAPGAPGRRPAGRSRSGRRAGGSGTREAILAAARTEFAGRGYDRATIRAIAAAAGVDPALVHHFYGTKEALFVAAMRLPVIPSEVLTAALSPGARRAGDSLGEHLVRTALMLWDTPDVQATMTGLLRSAMTGEQAAVMLREFIADAILRHVARAAGLADLPRHEADFRVGLVATQMLGLALARHVLALPAVAGAGVDELAAAVGPVIDRYLTGAIQLPQPPGRRGRADG